MPKLLSQKKKKIYLFDFYSVIIYQPRYLAQEPQKKEKEKKSMCIYIYIYIYETPMLQKKIKKISQYMHVY